MEVEEDLSEAPEQPGPEEGDATEPDDAPVPDDLEDMWPDLYCRDSDEDTSDSSTAACAARRRTFPWVMMLLSDLPNQVAGERGEKPRQWRPNSRATR